MGTFTCVVENTSGCPPPCRPPGLPRRAALPQASQLRTPGSEVPHLLPDLKAVVWKVSP